jgi:hypothetical protein
MQNFCVRKSYMIKDCAATVCLFEALSLECSFFWWVKVSCLIQYKWLVTIYLFPETVQPLYSKTELSCSVFQFLHSYDYICVRFIYFQDRSVCFAAAKYVG